MKGLYRAKAIPRIVIKLGDIKIETLSLFLESTTKGVIEFMFQRFVRKKNAEVRLAASCGMNMTGSNHDHGYENCPGYFSILSPSFEHLELSFRAALVIVK